MNQIQKFESQREKRIKKQGTDETLKKLSGPLMKKTIDDLYSYNFQWMGRPIIQYPQDIVSIQELIWATKPDLIIETGIAHGGSLILSASMLSLLDYCDALESGSTLDPGKPHRRVLGIDIDIRKHNLAAIRKHPMSNRIDMLEGSSIAPGIIKQAHAAAGRYKRILVCLDSMHTHDHVLAELEAYAPLTSIGSYCVVFDTIIETLPPEASADRPWGPGNNPRTAVQEFLNRLRKEGRKSADGEKLNFEIDQDIENKLIITAVPGGYLKRVAD